MLGREGTESNGVGNDGIRCIRESYPVDPDIYSYGERQRANVSYVATGTEKENITWPWLQKGNTPRSERYQDLKGHQQPAMGQLLTHWKGGSSLSTRATETHPSVIKNPGVAVWWCSIGKSLTKDSWETLNLQNNSSVSVLFCFWRTHF